MYIDLRDVDQPTRPRRLPEHFILKNYDIQYFSVRGRDQLGIQKIMEWSFHLLTGERRRPIHLSFDIDAPDPALAPAPGTPVVGGPTYGEGTYMPEEVVPSIGLPPALDLAEVNHPQLAASEEGSQGTVAGRWMWLLQVLVRRGREGTMSVTSFLLPVHRTDQKMRNV